MTRILHVTPQQKRAAQLLVKMSDRDGVPVDPIVRKVAAAQPRHPRPVDEDVEVYLV